ncbi:MAG: imidazolonepropionase-like amidohydrolase [Lysobacterales bacterium]|jgi:imidazolonepropionase-like amidohydrolase
MIPSSRLAIALTLLICSPVLWAKETQHYDWLSNGVKSGNLIVTSHDNGKISTGFEFKDRGRGPSIREDIHINENGLVTELIVSGHSYMGALVDENFIRTCDGSNWHSTIEQGRSDVPGIQFYLANDGSPHQSAMLAKALLATPDGEIDLLPSGRASITLLARIPGAQLYAINGLGFDPRFVWLDESQNLYGLSSGSNALVPSGNENAAGLMKASQDKAELEYLRARSGPLTNILPDEYAITNVHVVDVQAAEVLRNHNVLVRQGLIVSVSESLPETEDIQLIDGNGGYLMPGLWDMHTHTSLEQGVLHVAAGVTTVRDLGNNPDNYFMVREGFDSGKVIGPRSFAAGIVEGKSPFSAPIKKLAESAQQAVNLVNEYADMGYPQIKIYSSLDPDWVKPVTKQAHERGMRVSGHVPAFMSATAAVEAGYDELQHINFLFLNFLASPQDDTRTPLRFSMVAEQSGSFDLQSEQVERFVKLLADKQVVVDPTVSIYVNMFTHRSGELSPSFAMIAERLPPSEKRGMLAGRMDVNDENAAQYARSADAMLLMVKKLHDQGVTIVAGTDSLPGFGLHRELELYQQAGIPAPKVLRIATLGASEVMGVSDQSGSISPGKRADMVLLSENPLEDISAVRGTKLVFKGDRYFDSQKLYQAIGIKPKTPKT